MAVRDTAGPLMLASVMTVCEARACVEAGVDVIDCKDPSMGALGALDARVIKDVVAGVDGRVRVSATVGDLPCRVEPVVEAAVATAALGVDFVKVGLFYDHVHDAAGECAGVEAVMPVIEALGRLELGGARLVAVLLADERFDVSIVSALGKAGFAGVMVDTADKAGGSIVEVLDPSQLAQFVATAREVEIFSGIAGRLRIEHIPEVSRFGSDIIGFRGALCAQGERGAGLDGEALRAVRRAINQAGRVTGGADLRRGLDAASC